MTSFYFEDLSERYNCEIDDLRTDSEGKDVLNKRLQEKRQSFKSLTPMLEEAPEMVASAFHGAFRFKDRHLLGRASNSVCGLAGFPSWAEIEPTIEIEPWARPLIELCLQEADGEAFLVTSVVLEWMLAEDIRRPQAAQDAEDEIEDDTEDLGDSGADWMSTQGFDDLER